MLSGLESACLHPFPGFWDVCHYWWAIIASVKVSYWIIVIKNQSPPPGTPPSTQTFAGSETFDWKMIINRLNSGNCSQKMDVQP